MNSVFSLTEFSFTYPGRGRPALSDVELEVGQGEFLVFCGSSGCGKTTLLRQLKTALAPKGERKGEVRFEGRPLEEWDQRAQAARIGFVGQSPENQIVTDKVWHELAFGLESLGADTPAIRRRVAEMAAFFGITGWFHRKVTDLSGGQKQLLNLASTLVMGPDVLILDEPTSQLDPIAASEFLSALGKVNRELGVTILLSEHRLEEAVTLADRVVVMEVGRILCAVEPQGLGEALAGRGLEWILPTPARVWGACGGRGECPLTVGEGRRWLARRGEREGFRPLPSETRQEPDGPAILEAEGVWFRYDREGPDIVRDLSLSVRPGELVALLGGNGTGKTTSLKLLSGLIRPQRGTVRCRGTVGVLPQSAQTLFLKKTVREDLEEAAAGEDSGWEARRDQMVELCGLSGLLERHPYDLSGGEQQRLALAKTLLRRPDALLLDEPTKGLDGGFKEILGGILEALLREGTAVVMVSHDVEFCAAHAHRCALFFDGNVVAEGTPRAFFSGNSFYTTAADRMARGIVPGAVTAGELIAVCGGSAPERIEPQIPPLRPAPPETPATEPAQARAQGAGGPARRRIPGRTVAAVVSILLLIPLTLWAGMAFFGDRRYYLTSFLVLMECMLPFFFLFEGRRPRARELVVVAVLCALGVAGRAVFAMLPQFKPVLAIVAVSGAALGGETGFLVGAATMLCSNAIYGQGPYTPWQMFAMGLVGALAGALFHRGPLPRRRLWLALYGAVAAVALYGGIMNLQSALFVMQDFDWGILAAYLASGFPMDCVHGFASFLFLFFGGEPMVEKLERVKTKYAILE